ncbi:MAG: hypothetical protein ACRDV4_09735, partial [Acidimicrobiales bacterium]
PAPAAVTESDVAAEAPTQEEAKEGPEGPRSAPPESPTDTAAIAYVVEEPPPPGIRLLEPDLSPGLIDALLAAEFGEAAATLADPKALTVDKLLSDEFRNKHQRSVTTTGAATESPTETLDPPTVTDLPQLSSMEVQAPPAEATPPLDERTADPQTKSATTSLSPWPYVQVSPVPEASAAPDLTALPDLPDIEDLVASAAPDLTALPDLPDIEDTVAPEVPSIPDSPTVESSATGLPPLPKLPDIQEAVAPEVPSIPDAPEVESSATGFPTLPKLPDIQEAVAEPTVGRDNGLDMTVVEPESTLPEEPPLIPAPVEVVEPEEIARAEALAQGTDAINAAGAETTEEPAVPRAEGDLPAFSFDLPVFGSDQTAPDAPAQAEPATPVAEPVSTLGPESFSVVSEVLAATPSTVPAPAPAEPDNEVQKSESTPDMVSQDLTIISSKRRRFRLR